MLKKILCCFLSAMLLCCSLCGCSKEVYNKEKKQQYNIIPELAEVFLINNAVKKKLFHFFDAAQSAHKKYLKNNNTENFVNSVYDNFIDFHHAFVKQADLNSRMEADPKKNKHLASYSVDYAIASADILELPLHYKEEGAGVSEADVLSAVNQISRYFCAVDIFKAGSNLDSTPTQTTESETWPTDPEEPTQPSTSAPPADRYAPYKERIGTYRQALTIGVDAFNENYDEDYSSINTLMVFYFYNYDGNPIQYATYDIDENGTAELVFSDGNSIIDIYTLHNGTVVKLFEDCYFGERSRLHILDTGLLLSEGSDSAASGSCRLYRIDTTAGTLSTPISAYYYDENGPSDYMTDYTFVDTDEYFDNLDAWMQNSIFDAFEWIPVVE